MTKTLCRVLTGLSFAIGIGCALAILFVLHPYNSELPTIPTHTFTASQCVSGCEVTGTLAHWQVDEYPFFSFDRYNLTFSTDDVNSICVSQDNITDCVDIYDATFSFCCVTLIGIRAVDLLANNVTYNVTFKTVDVSQTGQICICTATPTGEWLAFAFVLLFFTILAIIFWICSCCKDDGFVQLMESPREVRLPEWSDETGWKYPEKRRLCDGCCNRSK